jgi:rod shape-determining protein MreB
MIVSEPFAVAYGMDSLLHTMIIDIGAGTTDFCVMNGRYPTDEDQRTLTNAGDAIDEHLATLVRNKLPDGRFSVYMVREWKEKGSFVGEPKKPVSVKVPVHGKPTDLDITAEMRRACESLLGPISETMLDLISRVEPEYQEDVRRNVILAGGGSQISGLAEALEGVLEELGGGRVRAVDDPVFAGSNGGLAIALDAPETDWESLAG